MTSIWNICEKIESVKCQKDDTIYHKAKLNIALKEIKAENSQQKLKIFNKIEDIKKSNFIKIYDYFDENDTIYILLECIEDKIFQLNEFLKDNEEKIVKEIHLKNHGGPIHKTEINRLFKKGIESMCKILIRKDEKKGTGTGFFCKIRHPNINLSSILLTNNHVLGASQLKEGNIIEFEYNNIIQNLVLTKERRFYTNPTLDYTCIEILDSDNILNFFEIDEDIINEKFENLKESEIFILQFPKGDEISFSQGKIMSFDNKNRIIHSASTDSGSSGSPIILRNSQYNFKICGIHFGGDQNKNRNYASLFTEIVNDLKIQVNSLTFNTLIDKIEIKNHYLNNLIILQDGRLSGCKSEIVIFNKNDYKKIDLTIKPYPENKAIVYHIQLTNGNIIACSYPIKIIKLKKNFLLFESYEIIQTIENDFNVLCEKIIELDYNRFAASFENSMVLFYSNRNNNNYYKNCANMQYIGEINDYYSMTGNTNLLKLNDNEFVGTSKNNKCIQFFIGGEDDIVAKKLIENINSNGHPDSMIKCHNILLVGGQQSNGIYLIDLKEYELIGKAQTELYDVFSMTNLTNGNILAGVEEEDRNFSLVEYKIEQKELIPVQKKVYAHSLNIFNIIQKNKTIITNSNDGTIKFWE